MTALPFSELTRAWFAERFAAPTRVQELGWARIAAGEHTLMLAPTGSGKTLAAFLACLDRLTAPGADPGRGTRVVYVSPIKALAYDVEKNLRAPLAGLERVAAARGLALRVPRIDVRTGDTPARERRRQQREPGEILITTPESLYLVLGSAARAALAAVDTVIVDEIHALAPTKRGAHLALSLERLSALVTAGGRPEPQRIGLSATQRPLAVVARFLGGDRPVAIVDAGERPRLDLEIVVPVDDMTAPPPPDPASPVQLEEARGAPGGGLWPSIYPRLLELVLAHRSTILFVNSRRLAERLATQLTELARAVGAAGPGEELVRAHHGSVARLQRLAIEEELKAGRLRAITATSSLELGIDMGAVDLVVQVESPGAIARGLQRIGRAGHQVGAPSRGRIVPKFRGDLLEAAVCARGMLDGEVEPVRLPELCLDVLAQQVVAMCALAPWPVAELLRVATRAAGYRGLSRAALDGVLDMLSGRYPSDELAALRPRLVWDRAADVVTARPGARLLAVVNAGTIPDRGLYGVHLGDGGPRIGELDEEMVAESRRGETFLLGATTWRIDEITRDRVIVSPAPGEPGKMPFWRGEGPGRPVELGRALGALVREVDALIAAGGEAAAAADLRPRYCLDERAARNLVAHVAAQRAAAGTLPTDRVIVVERFRDELGDWRLCVLSPLGARVHAPWALLIARRLEERLGYTVHAMHDDDGIALRFAEGDELPAVGDLFPAAAEVEELLVAELARSPRFAALFRENAARALLLPRRRPGQRTPLWSQRQRAQQLMAVALRYPAFPIVLETYREALRDVFDVPALRELLAAVERREVRVDEVTTVAPSPFATSLVFDYVAEFLYQGDLPVAERRAQTLALDRGLLRELVGAGEARALLDPAAVAEVEAELAGRAAGWQARTADELTDLLRRVGELDDDELAARVEPGLDVAAALAELATPRRVLAIEVAGARRWIVVEDAARYRDGLGVALPAGLPAALLDAVPDALTGLLARWARGRGPFALAPLAARWGLPPGALDAAASALVARGALVAEPDAGDELVDPEVLRRLRRRTLERLRAGVAPVDVAALARFLPRWQGVGAGRRGPGALRAALEQLEGAPLPFAELEARLLPARVADFAPRMLDELGAMGEVVWVGCGALGRDDGRVRIVRRARAAALLAPGELPADAGPVARAIVEHLRAAGASFLVAIEAAVEGAVAAARGAGGGGSTREQVRAALWELVWAGVVTNDTFAPLRSLRVRPRPAAASGRRGRTGPGAAFGGRWSLVASLVGAAPPSATARAHATATALAGRWGVVTREAAAAEELAGGFAALVPVLDALEEAGALRRGHFVAGLGGRQYAGAGAVDRLREPAGADEVVALAAVDPACPWGALVPWPELTGGGRPARRSGASVILVGGAPVLWLEARGGKVATFAGAPATAIERALAHGLPQVAASRRRPLVIESVDGERTLVGRWAAVLERAGLRRDYKGHVVTVDAPR